MPKKYSELTDIAPELIAMWQAALDKGEFSIELDNERDARSLQARLYSVRKVCKARHYANAALFDRFEVSRSATRLTIRLPVWLQKSHDALEAVGVKVPPLPKEDEPQAELQPEPEQLVEDKPSNQSRTLEELFGSIDRGSK